MVAELVQNEMKGDRREVKRPDSLREDRDREIELI
jgi:hypothetical protein